MPSHPRATLVALCLCWLPLASCTSDGAGRAPTIDAAMLSFTDAPRSFDGSGDLAILDACQPTTCSAQEKDCGLIASQCGGTEDCGACPHGIECGGGGEANVCGTGHCFIEPTSPKPGSNLSLALPWSFSVPQVSQAELYLWSLVQGGKLVLERSTTTATLVLSAGEPERVALQPGQAKLWIRASYDGSFWTCAATVDVTLTTALLTP